MLCALRSAAGVCVYTASVRVPYVRAILVQVRHAAPLPHRRVSHPNGTSGQWSTWVWHYHEHLDTTRPHPHAHPPRSQHAVGVCGFCVCFYVSVQVTGPSPSRGVGMDVQRSAAPCRAVQCTRPALAFLWALLFIGTARARVPARVLGLRGWGGAWTMPLRT